MGLNLHTGGKKENRVELDFYSTPVAVTIAICEFIKSEFDITPEFKVYEPACGSGAMLDILKQYFSNVNGSDIRTGTDYLLTQISADLIITNPPFFLAQQFIEKALLEAPIVAMLLKSQYWHAKSRIELFKQNPPSWILPLTWRPDFLKGERGGRPTMECIWTVWNEGTINTRYKLLEKPL